MNKIKKYIRKKKHINFVQDYVDDLMTHIFRNAVNGQLVHPSKSVLFKKYSKYLKILKF